MTASASTGNLPRTPRRRAPGALAIAAVDNPLLAATGRDRSEVVPYGTEAMGVMRQGSMVERLMSAVTPRRRAT